MSETTDDHGDGDVRHDGLSAVAIIVLTVALIAFLVSRIV